MDRNAWLAPLRLQRFRVLDCLEGNQIRSPGYLAFARGVDAFNAFRTHVETLSRRWADEPHGQTRQMLAAARVLVGDLAAADTVIDGFPVRAYELDHGHGYCNVAHLYALSAALPLPTDLRNTKHWLAGSSKQAALHAWLAVHRNALRWVEEDGTYVLDA